MKKHSAVIPPPALSWVVSFSVKHHLESTPAYEMHFINVFVSPCTFFDLHLLLRCERCGLFYNLV